MKRRTKWLICLLVVGVLAGSLCLPALMADAEPLFSISAPERAERGDELTVQIQARLGGVAADGKLAVHYDSARLRYVGCAAPGWTEDAVSVSDNAQNAGKVILAFAADTPAEEGDAFALTFAAVDVGTAAVSIDGDGSYITGAAGYDLSAEASVTVEGTATPPNPPVIPVDPVRPSAPAAPATPEDHDSSCPSKGFVDLNFTGDFHDGIDYMLSNGYLKGTSATTFSPDGTMNRAMMVTILYRVSGSPAVSGSNPFTDVKTGDYFHDAVLWASANDITKGVSSTAFGPEQQLTREQVATFLFRYAQYTGMDVSARADLSAFADVGDVTAYAETAMQWAVGAGLINGTSKTTLSPQGAGTRAQTAVIIWRLVGDQD